MKKRYTAAIVALLVGFLFQANTTTAQVTWSRFHVRNGGDSNNLNANQRGLVLTQDGNYVHLTDTIDANGAAFIKLMKYDLIGKLLWSKIITQNSSIMCKELLELPDGKLVVVGEEGLQREFYWMVLTASGDFLAEFTHRVGPQMNFCFGAALSPAGNIVMTGSHYFPNTSNHELVWLEVTPTGNVNWTHYQTGAGWVGFDVEFLADGTGVIGYDKYFTDEIGFIRFDAAGNILSDQLSTEFFDHLLDMEAAPGGGMFVSWHKTGQTKNLAKLDNNLQTTWSILVQPTMNLYKISNLAAFPDGSCAALVDRASARILKVDANGNLLWEKPGDRSPEYGQFGEDLIVTNDNGLLYSSVWESNNGLSNYSTRWVTKTDQNGNIIKNRVIGHVWLDANGDCTADTSAGERPWREGTMKMVDESGSKMNFIPDSTGRFSSEIYPHTYQVGLENSVDGYFIPCLPLPAFQTNPYPDTIVLDTIFLKPNLPNSLLQGIAFLDVNQNGLQDPGDSALACVTLEIYSNYPSIYTTVVTDEDGMFALPVYQGSIYNLRLHGSLGNCTATPFYLIPINGPLVTQNVPIRCSSTTGTSSMVRGKVLLDANSDCLPDNYANLIGTWTVKMEEATGTVFEATTDDEGNFALPISPGSYTLKVVVQGNELNICNIPTTYQVALGQCISADIIGQLPNCPSPSVEVSVDRFRRCITSNIQVNYCNYGTDPAYDASLQLLLDPALEFSFASLPLSSQSGDTLLFNLGNLDPLECGGFVVKATLDCNNSILGQTHCVEATILPAAPCSASNANWDGSNIELSSRCEQGQVIFTLHNTGAGNMAQPNTYIIIEDNVLLRPDEVLTYILPANGDTSIVLPADGSTLRLETYQAPGHPTGSLTAAWEEGCGANPPANFSRGFVTQRPYGDEEPFIAVFCDEVVGSYDPNIKKAIPKGIGNRHFVQNSTTIDYQILFQNTGTDTAYSVVLRDTLSLFLDPTSIRPGAASHPYSYTLENGTVAVFTFENINLVDSTTNAEGSIGFVQFSIEQAPNNPPGTRIENSAAIYFDFNEPVITPTVFHEIPAPVYYQSNSLSLCAGGEWNGTVFNDDTIVMDTVHFGIYDSVYITTIGVLLNSATNLSASICNGESYTFGNASYSLSGSYEQVFAAQNGCDSTITLHLTVLPALQSSFSQAICSGESFAFGNASYSQSGSYEQVFAAQNGCDSTITLHLTVLPAATNSITETLCFGGSTTVNGTVYDEANPIGTEVIMGGSHLGCDSIVQVSLGFNSVVMGTVSPTLCPGGQLVVNGTVYDAANPNGTEVFPNGSYLGCDSTVLVSLGFYPTASSVLQAQICPDESIIENGTVYDAVNPSGTETLAGASTNGCDSTIYISLEVLENPVVELAASICVGENYPFYGEVLAMPGNYTALVPATDFGCDSIIYLSLSVLPVAHIEIDTTVLPGTEVFGVVVLADTLFTQSFIDENGCVERTVTVHLPTDATPGLENLRHFAIAPNPASGHLILSGQLTTGAFCEAKLVDAYGRTVAQLFDNEWIAGSFSRRVDLRDVPPGLYFVSFAMDGVRWVRKVVVE